MPRWGGVLLCGRVFGAAEHFCGAGGVGGALPKPGPVQPAPVTNTSWFSACLPGAGASLGIADSPQHLPLLPPQLPDEYFPFSHYFNCPTWRKLLRTGSGLLRTAAPAGHPRSGGVGDGMGGLPITAAHKGAFHASAMPGPAGMGARAGSRVFGGPARCTHPQQQAGGRRRTDAGSCMAECGPTGLRRGPSRWAGFLGRLKPAPAPAASPRVLPALAPGHGPEPWRSSGGRWHRAPPCRGSARRVVAVPCGAWGRDARPTESPEHQLGMRRSPCAPLPWPHSRSPSGEHRPARAGCAGGVRGAGRARSQQRAAGRGCAGE